MRQPTDELEALKAAALLRQLRVLHGSAHQLQTATTRFYNFASNDYLGLAEDEELKGVFIEAVQSFGVGAGASRLVSGTRRPHARLEECLAAFKGVAAALTFTSGYTAAVGTLSALMGQGDIIIMDKLCHASLIDGARLSGATLRVFPHNDLAKLASHLRWARTRTAVNQRILVVVESIYSMDGDAAPLEAIVRLKEEHGAWLLVDEAHAVGICGPQGRGLAAAGGLAGRVDLQMGTLSKAVGLSGGYVAGTRELVDLLINKARSFIYTTAPPPAVAATAAHAIERVIPGVRGDALRARLRQNMRQLTERLNVAMPPGAILPHITGSESSAMLAAEAMMHKGYFVPAIRFPTVPRGAARLRITLSATHQPAEIEGLAVSLLGLGV